MEKAKKYLAFMAAGFIFATGGHTMIPDDIINMYLAYEDMEVKTPFIHRVRDPRLEGLLVNRSPFALKVKVKLSFYTVFREVLEEVTISAHIPPEGSHEFEKKLSNREQIDRIRRPYGIEWEMLYLEVDGEQIDLQ
ncbi:MAG: hypothetical protein KGY38_01865 [Desulfobacterales bacterium]|nr:hypothetical protein [Desulfobacterales bacterium]